jgi:hypothetical protein
VHLAIQLLVYSTYEFGHDADQSQHLAFGLIGKDGPHRIIKICFGNMNLVFGSEVALLGFWEYMFQILFRVKERFLNMFEQKKIVQATTLSIFKRNIRT